MTDDTFRATIEAAESYKAAAAAIGEPYGAVYARARKLGVRPKNVEARAPRRERTPAPQSLPPLPRPAPRPGAHERLLHDPTRKPAPEPTPPVLSPWIPMPDSIAAKADVVAVRIDQKGRVRAAIQDVRDGWCTWVIRDVTGAVVGKLGLRGGLTDADAVRQAKEGADAALVELDWLPANHNAPTAPCAAPAPVCTPKEPNRSPDMLGALRVACGAAAEIALIADEDNFAKLARWCFRREQKEHAA